MLIVKIYEGDTVESIIDNLKKHSKLKLEQEELDKIEMVVRYHI